MTRAERIDRVMNFTIDVDTDGELFFNDSLPQGLLVGDPSLLEIIIFIFKVAPIPHTPV